MNDYISRQTAIDALWKALYEYEDKTEKQFIESDELDVEDWVQHRIFVQNMNDIDRQTIRDLPSAEPQWIPCSERLPSGQENVIVTIYDDHGDTPWEYTTNAWHIDGVWIADNDIVCGSVIAWMPLPEPYEKG